MRVQACFGLYIESKPWVQQKSLPEVCGWVCWGWWGGVEGWEEVGTDPSPWGLWNDPSPKGSWPRGMVPAWDATGRW